MADRICKINIENVSNTSVPASDTGGSIAISIQGRLYRERERLSGCGMSDKEREWRAQWIRDQRICENEPVDVPEIYKQLNNPIRRFCRYPLDQIFKPLVPIMGKEAAGVCRHVTGKLLILTAGIYAAAYYFKYNANDWTRKGGWRVVVNRPSVVPGDPNWPLLPTRHSSADYADRNFKNSPI